MKTYTQKQYDSAKERAYKKGYGDGLYSIPQGGGQRIMSIKYGTSKPYEVTIGGGGGGGAMADVLESNSNLVKKLANEVADNADEIKQWKKWEQFDFDLTLILCGILFFGVILTMIF